MTDRRESDEASAPTKAPEPRDTFAPTDVESSGFRVDLVRRIASLLTADLERYPTPR